MPKVSIIVPVYNIEPYIARCIDSVLSQSLKDIEIICVNDGSTDASLRIIEQYRKLDKRVKIINKENGGLSSARNAGVSAAHGKYILLLDGDDKISCVACERLYNFAEEFESDLVIYEYLAENINTKVKNLVSTSYLRKNFQNTTFSIATLDAYIFQNIVETAWAKLYRADLIRNIPFYEDIIYEDIPFWADVFIKAKRISYFPEAIYYYYQNRKGSIMQKADEKHFDIFKACQRREKSFRESVFWDEYKKTIEFLSMRDIIRTFGLLQTELKEIFYNKIKEYSQDIDFGAYENIILSEFERNNLYLYKAILEMDYSSFCKNFSVVNYG